MGNKVVRRITVRDTTRPTCSVRGRKHIIHYSQDKFKDPGVKRADTCDKKKMKVQRNWNKAFNERKIGDYVRTYKVKDVSGNSCTTQRVYSVVDNKIPKLNNDMGASCVDHVDGNLKKAIEVVGSKAVSLKVPGTYKVNYDCQDLSGNMAPQLTRVVKVRDTIRPVLKLTGAAYIKRESGFKYHDKLATAVDTLNGRITKKCSSKAQRMCIQVVGKVNINKPGTYTIEYRAMDKSGNRAVPVKRVVKVVDTLPPVITLKLKGKKIHKSFGNQRGQNGQRNPAGWK